MHPLLARWLLALALVLGCGVVGAWIGLVWQHAASAALAGAVTGLAIFGVLRRLARGAAVAVAAGPAG